MTSSSARFVPIFKSRGLSTNSPISPAKTAIMVKDVYTKGGALLVAEVHVQDGETLESALRRFKRKVQQEDIIKEIKRHSFYLKPGEKKRTKEALARKRKRKTRNKEIE